MIHHQNRGKRAREINSQIGHGANPLLPSAGEKL
jgi:hypothetical protein